MIYSLSAYTYSQIKYRLIAAKIYDLTKDIPREYRAAAARKLFGWDDSKQETIHEYEKAYNRATRYRKLLRKWCPYQYFIRHYPLVEHFFQSKEKAIDYAKKFDSEGGYYRYIKISRVGLVDGEHFYKKEDFETISHYSIDKQDIWLKFTHDGDRWAGRFEIDDNVPDFIKVVHE